MGPSHQALSAAILTLLRPLVRILLRNGVAYGSFAELAKKTYVDVAFEEFTLAEKKQTVSRVSVLTGLTRKETRRLKELEQANNYPIEERYNRAVRVISGWLNDPRFTDNNGLPADLIIEGQGNSFADLVRHYSGDIPTQAMLSALITAESVQRLDNGRVRLTRHAYIPGKDPADKITILGTDTAELIATIDHNLTSDASHLNFQRKVSNDRIRADAVEEFHQISAYKAQALLEELDQWLSEHEIDGDGTENSPTGRYVSLGIFYCDQDCLTKDKS